MFLFYGGRSNLQDWLILNASPPNTEMKNLDLNNFFSQLDLKLASLDIKSRDKYIEEEFPKYPHIGRFIDPRMIDERDFYCKKINANLGDYSFDPLIAFDMNQVKYSKEILHPQCNCFRRSKIKTRPIKTSSHRDRIFYAAWNHYLSHLHKKWLQKNNIIKSVAAYIPETGKFNANYAKLAFDYIQGRDEYCAIALDVKSFFDKIPHNKLKVNLIKLIDKGAKLSNVNYRLYKATTKYTLIELEQLSPYLSRLESGPGMYFGRSHNNWKKIRDLSLIKKNKIEGIPQGLPCSGVLANIAMMQFDLKMTQAANELNSIYIRYADDIFIASPNKNVIRNLHEICHEGLDELNLPIANDKTEKFNFNKGSIAHPKISYLGLECKGNEVTIRMNSVNKFYQRTSRFIYSYVLTCKRRGIKPSRKKIRAIFSHSGKGNYYSYLRRTSRVFETDTRYKIKGIKGIIKNHLNWIDKKFDDALKKNPESSNIYIARTVCDCPLKMDN